MDRPGEPEQQLRAVDAADDLVPPIADDLSAATAHRQGETRPEPSVAKREPRVSLFYFHVAKTGGNSVNAFVTSQLGRDDWSTHLESIRSWHENPAILGRRFLSGHLRYEAVRDRIDLSKFVTLITLRRPIDHVVSHLAWLRRLTEPENYHKLLKRPAATQDFARKLTRTDLSSAADLRDLLGQLEPEQLRLVDNAQSRYMCSNDVVGPLGSEDAASARANLARIDLVGTTDQLAALLTEIAWTMGFPRPEFAPRENVQDEKFGLDATDPDIRAVLSPLIEHDEALYAQACERFRTQLLLGTPRPRPHP